MSNIDELKLRAIGIKEEVNEGANTADRVGGLLYDIIDSMGASDVQPDWNQGDSTQPDYIKNKPNIPSTAGLASELYVRNYTYDKQTIDEKVAQGGTFDPTNYYNKYDIDASQQAQDTEIAKKANSADLATVATSGDYDDLINKPTIPAAQVQADWNQTDSTKKDFIKNKPNIPEGVIVDTALSKTSINPVQNKVIAEALENAGGNPDKPYDPTAHSGLGRKTLELKEGGSNVLTQEDFSDSNTIYIIQYDFDLNGAEIDVPAGSIVEFDGGSINNGTFKFNGAVVEGDPKGTALYGVAYKDGKPLSHNYKRILPLSEVTEHAFASTKPFGCQLRIEGSMQSICVTDDYVFVFGNDQYGTYADTGIVALFDRKYNYLGQARIVEFEHANGCCVVDNYIFCASRSGSVAYASISNIVTACNNNGTVSGVSTISIPSVQTSFAIAYDSIRKEMAIIDSTNGEDLYYNIFSYNSTNKTLTLKKHFNVNITDSINEFIESPIITHRGELRGAPGNITYRNGVIYMVYWYHGGGDAEDTWYQSAHSVGYLIEIDACTGLPAANLGLFRQIGSVTEPEGLCFDPSDEDVLWTLPQACFFREDWARPAAAYINRISFTKEVSSSILNFLPESADTLPEQLATRYAFVDNTSTDTTASSSARTAAMNKVSTGSQACPFKSLDTAIILTKTGNDISIILTDTGKEYDLGTLVIINQKVTIAGSGNAKIKGKIQLENAQLTLVGVKFYNYDGGITISSINSNIIFSNTSITNRNSTVDPTSILEGTCIDLMYKSVLNVVNACSLKGYRTGIIAERDSNIVMLGSISATYTSVVYDIEDSYNMSSNLISKTIVDSTVNRKYITPTYNVELHEDIPSNITTMSAFESYAETLLEKDMDNPMSVVFISKGNGKIPAGKYIYSPTGLVHSDEWLSSIPQDNTNIFMGTSSLVIVDNPDQETIDNNKWRKASGYPIPSVENVSVDRIPSIKNAFRFTANGHMAVKEFNIKHDCWITFSVLAKGTGTIRLQFIDKNNTIKKWDYPISSSNWETLSMTVSAFGINGVGNFYLVLNSSGDVYVCAPKAEFASKPTAWSPNPADNNGDTASRPVGVPVGSQYFDTSISPARPIYWSGDTSGGKSGWVDAAGADV